MGKFSFGGQMRTIQCCECEWTCRKQLQEANKLYKLHCRLTHKAVPLVMDGFSTTQGMGGVTSSKRGNIKFIPLTPSGLSVA
jgi:hypothetical protein